MDLDEFTMRLMELLRDTVSLYGEVCGTWDAYASDNGLEPVNLKSRQVRDMRDDSVLYDVVLCHDLFLDGLGLPDRYRAYDTEEFDVKSRVKMRNSVSAKMRRYTSMEHQGKVGLNKCYNDLFGIRVIGDIPMTHDELCRTVFREFGLKCIDSTKYDPESGEPTYIATHVYISVDNRHFPWELQIWQRRDAESNYTSHEAHKQGYSVWEPSYTGAYRWPTTT